MNQKNVVFLLYFLISASFLSCEQNEIVYVTNTGRAYHKESCSSLVNSKIAVSIIDAARSHNACPVCNPPVIDILNIPQNKTGIYRLNNTVLEKSGDAKIELMLKADVVSHVDGDTVRVRINNPPEGLSVVETIRFLGVDTPETVHPNQSVQVFGNEASDFTRRNLLGKTVYLAFDWDLRDRYSRLLAYVYTASGNCFNANLIKEGFGYAYLNHPFQFMEEFKNFEYEARRQERGLWAQ
ncbi:MAG: thermonuclease family protein [Treponema sp.]|nr:thermonuclease family protein [Treponema sp.]